MASITKTFLKQRAAAGDPVKAGQWHAGFSKVKKYAEEQNIPFIECPLGREKPSSAIIQNASSGLDL